MHPKQQQDDVHRSDRLNVPAEPLVFVPNHTARNLKTHLRRAGIETTTPEGKLDFHALRTKFSTLLEEIGATEKTKEILLRYASSALAHKRYVKVRPGHPNEAVNQVAELLGLAYLYANNMPTPQKVAVGQNAQLYEEQVVKGGKRQIGAPGFEPISAIEDVLHSDHNLLTNKPQPAAVQNQPPTDSSAKPQPDDNKTHHLYANSTPLSGYPALARVVAAWPSLSLEEQQRILAIVQGRSAP